MTSEPTTTPTGLDRRSTPRPGLAATWHRARFDPDLTIRSQAEDVLFRHYLPLALDLANRSAQRHGDPAGARQTAEITLARTILDWTPGDASRFEPFVRLVIERSLHVAAAGAPAGRHLERDKVRP